MVSLSTPEQDRYNDAKSNRMSLRPSSVNNRDIILNSARVKLPTWGSWDILKAPWLQWSRCLKEGTHVSTRGTIHDQRDVSQGGLDQRDCPSDWTRPQNHSADRQRA